MNNQQRQQVLEQLKSSNHVLVTVSANPTVDELAASIGLTLAINKMNKHATTVFSGVVPSTIEFLQPEKTIETTTDSLRDFIISLDKSKADKLRYKVEDDVVRIFITPYRTTITGEDLEFSQGDFNVDLVIALGVTKRQDLDKAITAHGRILHDATIVTVTKRQDSSDLGAINWQDDQASSFCEMMASVITELDAKVLDGQMATSLLTGIIAETDRFKNSNTTPVALSLSSQLMQSGANQQLIAEKLDEPEAAPELHVEDYPEKQPKTEKPHGANGELEIDHSDSEIDKIHIDDNGNLNLSNADDPAQDSESRGQENLEPSSLPEELANYSNEEEYKQQDSTQDTQSQENKVDGEAQQDNQDVPSEDSSNPRDVGNDLFDDLSSQAGGDSESEPTLKQPDSSQTPMMQHEKVITPPSHPGDLPKSDKPFDPNEAMAAAGVLPPSGQPPVPAVEDTPKAIEATETPPAPVVIDTEPAPPELPKVESEQQQAGDDDLPPPPSVEPPSDTLADLEKSVDSPHVTNESGVDASQPSASAIHPPELEEATKSIIQDQPEQPMNFDAPKVVGPEDKSDSSNKDPNAPPPVPPPMTPQFYDAEGNNSNPFNIQNQ